MNYHIDFILWSVITHPCSPETSLKSMHVWAITCRCNWLRGDSLAGNEYWCSCIVKISNHYNDVTMGAMVSQITGLTIVHSTVYSGADQRKHQSCASQACVRGIERWPVYSPHKWLVTRKMFPFDGVIMNHYRCKCFIAQLGATSFQKLEALFHYWLGHR